MITSSSIYGLKMQWTPEHTQWAEQHFDISSTTRSPAHKVEAYRGHLQRSYQYAWANDDISALTASNLLKKYAEKYSGILEGPNERALLCSYSESAMNGRKSESESWQEGIYPTNCAPDVISVSKAGMAAALPPTDVCASIGSSPGGGALSEPSYTGNGCGSHVPGALHAGLPSQEYTAGYGGSYLHSSYSGQTPPALPSPLHSAGILQPPPAPPPPTLLPGYDAESPNLSGYSYPPAGYPPQTAVAPGYSPAAAPPPSTYLPAGIAAPTPLPPSALPGYTFQPHNHAAEAPLNGSTANSLKRKAFYMTGHGDMDSYGHFTYSQQRSSHSPMYRMPDSSVSDSNRANGFDRNAEVSSLTFKSTKQPVSSDQQRKCNLHSSRALSPPSFGSAKGSASDLRSGESYGKFGSSIISEQSEEHRAHLPHSLAGADVANSSSHTAAEQLKNSEAGLVAMVTTEILQQGPPVDWSDVAGLDMAKASIKEEILWPILRPDMFSGLPALPRSVLLFGPQGTGRTLLARCMAHQLGAVFLRLNSSALVTKWLGEGDKILQASFLVARCRQPAVIFISEVDLLLAAQQSDDSPVSRLQAELLLQLDAVLSSAGDRVLVVCSTNRPEEIPEDVRRYFTKRLLIPLPDHSARHQIIGQALAPHSYHLTEKDTALLVQRTEGFPGLDVARLCEEAVLGCLHGVPDPSSLHPGQIRPVSYQDFDNVFCKFQPSISQKELDMYAEWNKAFGCGQ